MAGEIYIADKTTLDSVNTKVTTLQSRVTTTVADKTTLDSVNTKVTSIQSSVGSTRNFMRASDLSKYKTISGSSGTSSTDYNLISVSGSGYLYVSLVSKYSTSQVSFTSTLVIDGVTRGNFSHNYTRYAGLIHTSFISSTLNGIAAIDGVNLSSIYDSPTSYSDGVKPLIVPVRFDTGFSVIVSGTGSATIQYFIAYILD